MDGSGTRVVEYTYDAWGKLISTSGTLASTLGADNPFRYRGYYYDAETGLYYLMTRYYDPEVGRFLSADVYLSTGRVCWAAICGRIALIIQSFIQIHLGKA